MTGDQIYSLLTGALTVLGVLGGLLVGAWIVRRASK